VSRDRFSGPRWPSKTVARPFGIPVELPVTILVGAILRLYSLGDESLWLDEAITVSVARNMGWWELLTQFPLVDPHPPLYYAVVWLWVTVGGASEWAVRFPSVVAGVAAIALLYGLTDRLFDRWTAGLAATFLAVSPFQIWYAQEARMYALTAALAVASMYALVRALDSETPHLLALYVLSTALFGYTHVFALFVIAAQSVFLTWHFTVRQVRQRTANPTESPPQNRLGRLTTADASDKLSLRASVVRWVGAQVAVVGLLFPWLAVLVWRTVLSGGEGASIVDWIPRLSPEHLWQLYTLFTFGYAQGEVPYWSLSAPPTVLLGVAALCLLLSVARPARSLFYAAVQSSDASGIAGVDTGDDPSGQTGATSGLLSEGSPGESTAVGLLLAWLLVPIGIAVVVSLAFTPVFVHRNLIVAAPAVPVLLAHGVRTVPRPPWQLIVAGLLVFGMLVALPGYYAEDQKEQWEDAAAYVDERVLPGDIVLVAPTYLDYPFLYYFQGDQAPVATIDKGITPDALAGELQDGETVYVVTAAHISDRDRTQLLERIEVGGGVTVSERREFNTVYVFELTREPGRD
jgi:mannosyltransferase